MPESPQEVKPASQPSPISPVTSSQQTSTPMSRPLSSGSAAMMNGGFSPNGGMKGRTPSPAAIMSSVASQQLPPACGARQLSKLKRFLTTLQQFGSDISPEIGDRVRTLVLGLVNNHLSIEEFHAKLQEATNFPLRPFVIPFLKANLPLLQRELLHCARIAKQSPQHFLTHNEHILFDPNHSPLESQESEFNENGKRRSPDRPKENGLDPHMDPIHPAKRHHSLSPGSTNRGSPNGAYPHLNTGGPIRLEDISISREMRERERLERERLERERYERDRDRLYSQGYGYHRGQDPHFEPSLDRIDDDWKHVETMLHCIIDMVGKTKRALAVLQDRSQRDREELSMWMRRHADGLDQDVKKRTNEMMAHTLRQTEDRVSEVKRRAEEAVQEVKRQAVSELQKAVAAAEQKATELVAAERAKMERSIADAKKKAQEEVMAALASQSESSESCWNCGRKASETCSGCNVARYCGSFCQHKDWERHHRVCGQTRSEQGGERPADQPPVAARQIEPLVSVVSPSPVNVNVTSPANSAASEPQSGSRSNSPADSKPVEGR